MDSSLKPILKRQLIFIAASLSAGIVLMYLFGFLVGLAANIAIFVAAIFFIRWRQQKALKSLGFGSQTAGKGYESMNAKIKYVCMSCGFEVKGSRCSCGSKMKRPLF